jgi:hypothetical protein
MFIDFRCLIFISSYAPPFLKGNGLSLSIALVLIAAVTGQNRAFLADYMLSLRVVSTIQMLNRGSVIWKRTAILVEDSIYMIPAFDLLLSVDYWTNQNGQLSAVIAMRITEP